MPCSSKDQTSSNLSVKMLYACTNIYARMEYLIVLYWRIKNLRIFFNMRKSYAYPNFIPTVVSNNYIEC